MTVSPRILVADDSEANRLALRLELLDAGFEVDEAVDGLETIRKLGIERYSALVTDVWMPNADGIAVVRATKALTMNLPIFVVTGGGPGLSIASASALAAVWGAEKVYVKPFDLRILVADLWATLASPKTA